jgi:alanyl-tRNA synthetase
VGDTVTGRIDWNRRFDLMQQHSGEHMVSGVVHKLYGWHNVGFHMGSEVMTVDFDGPIPEGALAEVEAEANRILWQNLPVRCWVPSPEELPSVTYRTKRALPWPVRIVDVVGADVCACCGIHVATTGEVGLVKLFSCVKFHQGVRIEMACGGRAMEILNRVYEQNRLVSQAFSAKIMETGDAAKKMNERLAAAEYRCAGLEKRIFATIAEGYAGKGDVLIFAPELNPGGARELADCIGGVCGGTAWVCSGEEGNYSVCLVNKQGDVKALGQMLKERFGARGGGKPGYFQGTLPATEAEIQKFFDENLKR